MAIEGNNVVVIDREFAAPVSKVFEALKAGRLFFNCGAWHENTVLDFRVGGKYRFDWGHHGTTTGEFTEIVENKRIGFTWRHKEGNVDSRVVIELAAHGTGTKLKLRHEGFDGREIAEMHEGGWTDGLTGLSDELSLHLVRIEREYLAPVEMLYQACAGEAFFANLCGTPVKSKLDFRVGGRYSYTLDSGKTISGEFTEIVKEKKIVFTWEAAPCGVPVDGVTTVTLEFGPWGEDGKNSYLCLTHDGFKNSEAARAHHEGWNKILRKIYDRSRR